MVTIQAGSLKCLVLFSLVKYQPKYRANHIKDIRKLFFNSAVYQAPIYQDHILRLHLELNNKY